MATRSQYSGAVGTVVDGSIRDLQEHRDLNYPVANGVCKRRGMLTYGQVFARDVGTSAPAEVVRVSGVGTVQSFLVLVLS